MENIKPKILFDDMVYRLSLKDEEEKKVEKLFIFKQAFDEDTSITLCETNGENNPDSHLINTSAISTILIQNVGRYCDNYASDFLINWKNVEHVLSTFDIKKDINNKEIESVIIVFGLRESGVDHAEYILSTAQSHNYNVTYFENYYRKVYAVEISKDPTYSSHIKVTLKDIKCPLSFLFYNRIV